MGEKEATKGNLPEPPMVMGKIARVLMGVVRVMMVVMVMGRGDDADANDG